MRLQPAIASLCLAWPALAQAQVPSDQPLSRVESVAQILAAHPADNLHLILIHGIRTSDRTTWQDFRKKVCPHLGSLCTKGTAITGPVTARLVLQDQPPSADYFGRQVWSDDTSEAGRGSTAQLKWDGSRPFIDHYRMTLSDKRVLFIDEINYWPLLYAFKCQFIVQTETELAGPDDQDIDNCAVSDDTHYAWFTPDYASQLKKAKPLGGPAPLANAYIKDSILDWGISDAVLSIGTLDRYIRETVRCAFSDIAGETPETFGHSPTVYHCDGAALPTDTSGAHFVLISHSLGAFVLMDAFASAAGQANEYPQPGEDQCRVEPASSPTHRENVMPEETRADIRASQALCLILRKSDNLFFLANQFPLIEMARTQIYAQPTASPHTSALVLWAETRETPGQVKQIVAFSDPGDVLTFNVAPIPQADVINAYPKNAPRWFGVLEMPGAAHVNYLTNDRVLSVIFGK